MEKRDTLVESAPWVVEINVSIAKKKATSPKNAPNHVRQEEVECKEGAVVEGEAGDVVVVVGVSNVARKAICHENVPKEEMTNVSTAKKLDTCQGIVLNPEEEDVEVEVDGDVEETGEEAVVVDGEGETFLLVEKIKGKHSMINPNFELSI